MKLVTSNPVNLGEYIEEIEDLLLKLDNFTDIEISGITNDSRAVKAGSIFVAIKGAVSDGHDYINSAIDKGASAIVYHNEMDDKRFDIPFMKVADAYRAYARLAEKFFGKPAGDMKLIGVTGTNGKTTCAFLLHSILSRAGYKTGLISTICYDLGNRLIGSDRTTPEAWSLQEMFAEMKIEGCEYVVMEVSSHALDQHRVGEAKFNAMLFTNLSGDHLDYHKDMDDYFNAKKKLFTEYNSKSNKDKDYESVVVINGDDSYGKRLCSELQGDSVVSYGMKENSTCQIISTEGDASSSIIKFKHNGINTELKSTLIGEFNTYNVLGVYAICRGLGISENIIKKALNPSIQVPGRLEAFRIDNGVTVFVDYAHTDDALQRALEALKKITSGKLIAVFGCGGDRDRKKRPRMGAVACSIADKSIITSDNPRTENPGAIIEDIVAGVDFDSNYEVHEDRKIAILESIESAKAGDVILIAGKGHEDYQEVNGIKHHFDDREEVRNAISQFGFKLV